METINEYIDLAQEHLGYALTALGAFVAAVVAAWRALKKR